MKIYIFILVLGVFFVFQFYQKNFIDLDFIADNAEYNIITYKDSVADLNGVEFIENGETVILKSTKSEGQKLKSKVQKIIGESFCFRGDFETFKHIVDRFNFNKIKEDFFGEIVCLYGFSNLFNSKEYIEINNTKYNTQIAFSNGVITVGYPIIVGSYWLKKIFWSILTSRRIYEQKNKKIKGVFKYL